MAGLLGSLARLFGKRKDAEESSSPGSADRAGAAGFTSPISSAKVAAAKALDGDAVAVNLYKAVTALATEPGNLAFSPASIRVALAMLFVGARGDTRDELQRALGFADDAAGLESALTAWNEVRSSTLYFAQRVWVHQGYVLLDSYLSELARRFDNTVDTLDFTDAEGTAARVNAWVSEKTRERIKTIVTPAVVKGSIPLLLGSAVYFKGKWTTPFDKVLTRDQPFMCAYPDGERRVPFMRATRHERYGEHDGAQLLSLPFGADGGPAGHGETNMLFILPKSRDRGALDALVGSLGDTSFAAYDACLSHELVALEIPRFRIETSLAVAEAVNALGIHKAFVYGEADLSGVDGTNNLYISAILHRAFVAVDEVGAEAAAVTVVAMMAGSLPPKPKTPIPFVADRPFLFLLRDRAGRVLFVGRVAAP